MAQAHCWGQGLSHPHLFAYQFHILSNFTCSYSMLSTNYSGAYYGAYSSTPSFLHYIENVGDPVVQHYRRIWGSSCLNNHKNSRRQYTSALECTPLLCLRWLEESLKISWSHATQYQLNKNPQKKNPDLIMSRFPRWFQSPENFETWCQGKSLSSNN